MKVSQPRLGGIAQSMQGRDKGKLYVICDITDSTLLLADGVTRTKASPKRKNVKHVYLLNKTVAEYGVAYPWDNSFDCMAAYALKQIKAELSPQIKSED
ncbi:MAG: KOW domain-containing RNA-binding protein [Candidatus Coproplasma sp.]